MTLSLQRAGRSIAGLLLMAACAFPGAQRTAIAQTSTATSSATHDLLDQAHAMEVRGRMDMAAQKWQQVLLVDPNNPDALGGLARDAKLRGNQSEMNKYLDKLKSINPSDPNIGRVQEMGTQTAQTAQLQQAGKYASSGQYAQAMTIYRQIFGNSPPPGEWALAYYETEAATEEGRPHAIAGLRAMMEKFPADSRYQVALGRILTYNPNTRAEGRRLLQRHPNDPQAEEALHQSLLWDSQNPAAAADIRSYLAKHNDAQLTAALKTQPKVSTGKGGAIGRGGTVVRTPTPISPEQAAAIQVDRDRSVEENAAYAALNAKRISEAEQRFKTILDREPDNPRALAGMGYVRMQQSNFGGAISFMEQAKQDGSTDKGLDGVLSGARFYYTMGEATTALNENDLATAEAQFQNALRMNRPVNDTATALRGLGGTLLKAQQPEPAIAVFERYVKLKPSDSESWNGLFMAQYGAGNAAAALATEQRMPAAIRAQLMRDPAFLRTLASAYSATGQDAAAQRVLHSALDLPFPAGANGLKAETQMQYADLLQQANHMDQAAGLYRQVVAADPNNAAAWEGLARVDHAMNKDTEAIQAVQSMPPSVYQVAMRDPGFESTVASIYESIGRHDVAQTVLDNAVEQAAATGQKPSAALQAQRAAVYMQRNRPEVAIPIYSALLNEDPNRLDVWKGLLSGLHSMNQDSKALAQIQQIPVPVRQKLETDPVYLQTVSDIYNGLGQPREAAVWLNRVQQHYAQQHAAPPADVDIQDAWLLYNGGNDSGLYRQLMYLGDRVDLNDGQRRTVQTIWANWAVRRSRQAMVANNPQRAIDILNAAAKSFPDNQGVIRALAAGYAVAGNPKQAVLIFKSQDMTTATASDYKAAVGAALAANDTKDAETWLRFGLDQYPRDSAMLTLAAKFEQARGNISRATEYYKASLAAMPPADPGAELASELSQQVPAGEIRLPTPAQARDSGNLASLLAPGISDLTGTTAQAVAPQTPYLPGNNNQFGQAPVQMTGQVVSPNGSYDGNRTVVPSYMTNPGYQTSRPAAPTTRPSTLKDYVPQASVETGPPSTMSVEVYQQQNIRRFTQRAQDQVLPEPQLSFAQTMQQPGAEVYGPYVPYVAPGAEQQRANYASVPNANSLGLGRPQQTAPQLEATDVFPAFRSLPGATPVKGQDAATLASGQNYDINPAQFGPQTAQPPTAPAPKYQGPIRPSRPTDISVDQPTRNIDQSNNNFDQPTRNGLTIGQQYPQPVRRVAPAPRRRAPARSRNLNAGAMPDANQPALVYPGVATPLSSMPYPDVTPQYILGDAPTDQQLVSKNVPPLRGYYDPHPALPGQKLSERDETELALAQLEGSYSGWVGGTAIGRYRSGTAGFDRLTDLEVPFEISAMLGKNARITVIPKAVFLDSGTVDTATFQSITGTVPTLGTLPANATTTPVRQVSTGVGGELQFTTANFGIAAGYTPYGFLISNWTGRLSWKLGHVTLFGKRDSVKDTQLSYAGIRDPGSATPVFAGNIWGGVMQTGGGLRFDVGTERSGFYVQGDGADLSGVHVLENRQYEGQMGAYFKVKTWPGYGSLNVGANFFGEHYDHNERGLTYGQGGYFSPNVYFLASVPLTFNGYYKNDWHYVINGAVGIQTFEEENAKFFPLDPPIQTGLSCTPLQITSQTCGQLPINSNTGLNYGINAEGSYRIADHWYAGAFLSGNNTNNYNTVSGGFFIRYIFKKQYPTETYPTGIFPVDGFRPLQVP